MGNSHKYYCEVYHRWRIFLAAGAKPAELGAALGSRLGGIRFLAMLSQWRWMVR